MMSNNYRWAIKNEVFFCFLHADWPNSVFVLRDQLPPGLHYCPVVNLHLSSCGRASGNAWHDSRRPEKPPSCNYTAEWSAGKGADWREGVFRSSVPRSCQGHWGSGTSARFTPCLLFNGNEFQALVIMIWGVNGFIPHPFSIVVVHRVCHQIPKLICGFTDARV